MLLTILLIVIVLLLAVIIVMLVTGWPGRQKEEIERLGNSLRREMAEQRSDNLQLMKAIRIVIEDAVRESVEREMAAAAPKGRTKRGRSKASQVTDSTVATEAAEEEVSDDSSNESPLQAIQISLFPANNSTNPVVPVRKSPPVEKAAEKQPDSEPETIHMGYVDDIPDVE
jgi:FtsZ-interacting cell division protein ZipA